MTIARTPVESSLITSIGYEAASRTLALEFKAKGSVYHYANVSPELHAELLAAKSIGAYFIVHIKPLPDIYPFTKQEPVAVPDAKRVDSER